MRIRKKVIGLVLVGAAAAALTAQRRSFFGGDFPVEGNPSYDGRVTFARLRYPGYGGMTNEGLVTGCWIDADGTEYADTCVKVSIECDRDRLAEAIRAVRRIARRLGQRAMYFEVSGYDGVQILRIE